jgi:perosamine synthetase
VIAHNRVCLTDADAQAVARVVKSGWIGQGSQVSILEAELAGRFRPGGAAAVVSSGTAALRLAMIGLGAESGTVAIPTYACSALYHAVNDGAEPVPLVDCTDETLCAHTANVIVHTYGHACPAACDTLIEDFTHAPGVDYGSFPCGSLGKASVISFGATKPLGAGAGGAVLGDADLIGVVKDLRDYDGKRSLGARFNFQTSDIVAALIRRRLDRLDTDNEWRRDTAQRYSEVCDAKGILIYGNSLFSNFYRFVIRVSDVASAIRHFARHGVEAINPLEPWELLHRQLGLDPAGFPHAEDAAAHTISLPIWPGMMVSEVERVAEALKCLEET